MPLVHVRYNPDFFDGHKLLDAALHIRTAVVLHISSEDEHGNIGADDMEVYFDPMGAADNKSYNLFVDIECKVLEGRRANHKERAAAIREHLAKLVTPKVGVWLKLVEGEWAE